MMNIGENARVYPLARVIYPERVMLGRETVIDDFAVLYAQGKGIRLGDFCHITIHCTLMSGGVIQMGDFSAIGPGGIILASSDDYKGEGFVGLAIFGPKYRKTHNLDVIMGNHVHIGAGSIILPGVTIGDGCSVGAGSVVTRDLPEWTICVGSPCKPVKDKPREKQLKMEQQFLEEYRSNLNAKDLDHHSSLEPA